MNSYSCIPREERLVNAIVQRLWKGLIVASLAPLVLLGLVLLIVLFRPLVLVAGILILGAVLLSIVCPSVGDWFDRLGRQQ